MTNKHNYEAALEDVSRQHTSSKSSYNILIDNKHAIQSALRLADRLQKGEVSDEMLRAACAHPDQLGGEKYIPQITAKKFKAMSAQLIKEETQ